MHGIHGVFGSAEEAGISEIPAFRLSDLPTFQLRVFRLSDFPIFRLSNLELSGEPSKVWHLLCF